MFNHNDSIYLGNSLVSFSKWKQELSRPSEIQLPEQEEDMIAIEKPKKKKKKADDNNIETMPKYVFVPKPRILRSDIRRSYCTMFVNVLNSSDFPLLYGFFETFCTPDSQQISLLHDVESNSSVPFLSHGVEDIAKCWFSTSQVAPDSVTATHDVRIHLCSGTNKSKIVSKFTFCATPTFDVPDTQRSIFIEVNKSMAKLESEAKANLNDSKPSSNALLVSEQLKPATLSRCQAIVKSFTEVTRSLPLLPLERREQQQLAVEGTMVIYTDENLRITRLVMESIHNQTDRNVL